MGWLRELMAAASPPVTSYGQLARRCLREPSWPAALRPQDRSLASLFSKLDRDIELEWLADREGVQRVLALVLGCPLGRIQRGLEGSLEAQDDARGAYRFRDAPRARPLELALEAPPPGFHPLLWAPKRWRRHFWSATEGDAGDLVAAWLDARGLAHSVEADHDHQALPRLDPEAANFVRLKHPPSQGLEWPELGLCISAPGPAPAGFTTVPTLPGPTYYAELLSWFADRFPGDRRLDPALAGDWLGTNQDLLTDFEAVVGCIALLDDLGPKLVAGKTRTQLAQLFASRRMRDGTPPGEDATWSEKHAFSIVVALVRSLLTTSGDGLGAARSRQEWIELVPEEYRRGVDVEWVKASLAEAGTAVSVAELERALTRVPPGAHRVVTALERAAILAPDTHGALRLGPRWFVRSAELRAVDELLSSSAVEWGEVLLGRAERDELRLAIARRIENGDVALIEGALDQRDAESPAYAAAVAALSCALGRALLAGVEIDLDLVAGLFELQSTLVVAFDDGSCWPRAGFASDEIAEFTLGAWSLCEALDDEGRRAAGPLDPSNAPESALEQVLVFLESQPPTEWVLAGCALLARIAAEKAPGHRAAMPLELRMASTWSHVAPLARSRHGLAALCFACESDPTRVWAREAAALWGAWVHAGLPHTTLFEPTRAGARELWRHVPLTALEVLFELEHPLLERAPWHWLDEARLRVVLARMKTVPPSVWSTLPEALRTEALAAALRSADVAALTTLWRDHPPTLCAATRVAQQTGNERELRLLLETAPEAVRTELVQGFTERVRDHGLAQPGLDAVRRWLLGQCRSRGDGFAEAYALLHDIEQRRARVARARGHA